MSDRVMPSVRWTAPLSPGQERLLAAEYTPTGAEQRDGGTRLRPLDMGAILVEGDFDPGAMQLAVDALVDRQEALRTTFRFRRDAPPVQVVSRSARIELALEELADVDGLPVEGLAALVRPSLLTPMSRLFDVRIARLERRRHVVVLRIHHLVSDGWSIGVLYRELSELYAAAAERRAPRLAPIARPFREHCVWMHGQRATGGFAGELEYWRSELAAAPARLTWSARLAPAEPTCAVDDEELRCDARLVDGLRAASRGTLTPGGLAGPMLAGLASVIHARTGAREVRVGMMIAGRTRAEDEDLIGNFVNIVVIRIAVDPEQTLRSLVAHVNAKVAAAMDHQRVPIQDVADVVPEEPETGRLYQVTFALNTMRARSLTLPGARCRDFGVSPSGEPSGPRFAATKINLRWLFVTGEDGLNGTLTYQMEEFDAATARAYVRDFTRALEAIVGGGDQRVAAALPML
jgi:hypothetical protein